VAEVRAEMVANVWKVVAKEGDTVDDGDTLVILESMKMEIPVEAEDDGVVKEIRCEEGQAVSEGDVLVVLE
jgi:biotin carboxyl carrier protein